MVGAGDDASHQDRKKQDREGDLISGFWTEVWGQLEGGGHEPLSSGPVEFKELEEPLCGTSQ